MSCKNSSVDCISTAQIRWNTIPLFSSNSGIFKKIWVEKNKLQPEKIELTHLFWESDVWGINCTEIKLFSFYISSIHLLLQYPACIAAILVINRSLSLSFGIARNSVNEILAIKTLTDTICEIFQ